MMEADGKAQNGDQDRSPPLPPVGGGKNTVL